MSATLKLMEMVSRKSRWSAWSFLVESAALLLWVKEGTALDCGTLIILVRALVNQYDLLTQPMSHRDTQPSRNRTSLT